MSARNWKHPGSQRWDEDLRVTPQIAAYWLVHTSPKQGKVRQSLVNRYAAMRRAGLWDEDNDSPIKLDTNGEVIDGKHRLWMVVDTELPTYFHIHYNVPTAVYDTTDTGRLRGLDDVAYAPFHGDRQAASVSKAMVSAMASGTNNSLAASLPMMRLFQEQHEDAIRFTCNLFQSTRRGFTAPMKAAIARAYYYVPRHELVLFADRMNTGVVADESESVVIRLRDWLISDPATRTGGTIRRETYLKTARAIQLFIERQPVQKLYAAADDPFPLPR